MKKIICFTAVLLLLFSAAFAESVTQWNYELIVDEEARLGKYTGEIVNGVPDGYGIFETTNPSGYSWHYIGNWSQGLMEGKGATYWEDGSLEIGDYEAGHFVFGYCSYDGADLELFSDSSERLLASAEETETPAGPMYIGNRNSKVFHYPECGSVTDMKEKNKVELFSREEALDLGYKPCQRCKP